MVSAPQNSTKLARLGTLFAVRIGDKDGNAPTAEDEFLEVMPLSIDLGTGGQDLDRATFQVDLGQTGQRIVDFQVDPKMNRQVEVYALDEAAATDYDDTEEVDKYVPLFWGEYDQQDLEIRRDGEFVVITASVQKQHFGKPLPGPRNYDKATDKNYVVDEDYIFNPDVQGKIYGNLRNKTGVVESLSDLHVFIPPEAAWTKTAKSYIEDTPELWGLRTAVAAMSFQSNEDETLVSSFLFNLEILDDAPDLKNFRIRRGTYLPAALDELLLPHGFSWHLDISLHGSTGEMNRYIRVFELGEGVEKQVYFQRPGEVLDPAKSNVPELFVETNLSELANRVTVFGGFIKKEVTVELQKCWGAAQDALTPDELQRRDEADSQFETFPNVHRKWAFNEGGDYIGLRPEFGNAPADLTFFDVDAGEEYVHKRRKTEPLLTYDKELNRRRQYLEYYDNSLSEWKPVPPEWGYRVLDDEIGVYFTGNTPPSELWEQGTDNIDNMRLRMTCVIACDKRVSYTAERRESSPNSRDIELTIDASDRFFKQTVHSSSTFYGDEELNNDEVDSTTDIEDYAKNLRDINDSARLQVGLNLFGIYHSYQRGDLITKIDGREISLNRNSSDAEAKRCLQVMRVVWDYQAQRTMLVTAASDVQEERT